MARPAPDVLRLARSIMGNVMGANFKNGKEITIANKSEEIWINKNKTISAKE